MRCFLQRFDNLKNDAEIDAGVDGFTFFTGSKRFQVMYETAACMKLRVFQNLTPGKAWSYVGKETTSDPEYGRDSS
jgi:hypothetical protein